MKLRTPWWFAAIDVIVAAAALCLSYAAADVMSSTGWLNNSSTGWLYPAYVVLSAVIAWPCYPTRRAVAWILVAMMALSTVALGIIQFVLPHH